MTDYERWGLMRDMLRIRLSQYEAKEERVRDEVSKTAVRYAVMTVKDMIRMMNKLEDQ